MPPSSTPKDLSHIFKAKGFANRYKLAEKATGLFARPLINQSGIASYQKPPVVFDNACGTGIISSILHRTLSYQVRQGWELTCGDFSESMVEYTHQRAKDEEWHNAEVKFVDAQETGFDSAHYTHIFAAFAFPSFLDDGAAVKECLRILQPGGILASTTWKKVPWISILESSIETLSPDLPFPDLEELIKTINKGWNSEAHVKSVLEKGGFSDIQVKVVTDRFLLPIAELVELNKMILPALLGQFWTKEQREEYEERVPVAMQQFLEGKYGAGGLVPLEPMAIIVTARK
ncbi:S-adenosyl-L-methionine-dependent methyltransferase [Aspergillus cavernicola]|uniref:S-adenosyl-L-methionine-dependent methyltransferase n=1 Tax=Aspergillus cavernicola TaxID=176166 RepID=A0ABR4J327_9EURO